MSNLQFSAVFAVFQNAAADLQDAKEKAFIQQRACLSPKGIHSVRVCMCVNGMNETIKSTAPDASFLLCISSAPMLSRKCCTDSLENEARCSHLQIKHNKHFCAFSPFFASNTCCNPQAECFYLHHKHCCELFWMRTA